MCAGSALCFPNGNPLWSSLRLNLATIKGMAMTLLVLIVILDIMSQTGKQVKQLYGHDMYKTCCSALEICLVFHCKISTRKFVIRNQTLPADWVWRLRVAIVIVVSDLLSGSNVLRLKSGGCASSAGRRRGWFYAHYSRCLLKNWGSTAHSQGVLE